MLLGVIAELKNSNNFYYSYSTNNSSTTVYCKDKILIQITNTRDLHDVRYYDEPNSIFLTEYNGQKTFSTHTNLDCNVHNIPTDTLFNYFYNDTPIKINSVLEGNFNVTSCYILTSKTDNTQFYIDKKTFFPIGMTNRGEEYTFELSFNTVTDEDVQYPDLTGYSPKTDSDLTE